MICPKCGYQRTQNDDPLIPITTCPSCQIIYEKYGRQAIPPTRRTNTQPDKLIDFNNITIVQAITIAIGLIVIITLSLPAFEKMTIHLIGPFDSRPEILFTEMVEHPERLDAHKKKLCAWATREEIRKPTFLNKLGKESACKNQY